MAWGLGHSEVGQGGRVRNHEEDLMIVNVQALQSSIEDGAGAID